MQNTRKQPSVQLSVLLATICVVFLLIGGAADAEEPPEPAIEYTVAPGDTLWDIAREHLEPGASIQTRIRSIKERSGLTTSDIYPGQVLYLPVG
jgi:LysM repeat protein